jgi:hypothetical protein
MAFDFDSSGSGSPSTFSLLQGRVVSGREDRIVCLVYRCEGVNAVIRLLPLVYRCQTRWNEFQKGKRFSTGSVLIEKKKQRLIA